MCDGVGRRRRGKGQRCPYYQSKNGGLGDGVAFALELAKALTAELAQAGGIGRHGSGRLVCVLFRLRPAGARARGGPPKAATWVPCQRRRQGTAWDGVGAGDPHVCVCPSTTNGSAGACWSGRTRRQRHWQRRGWLALGVGGYRVCAPAAARRGEGVGRSGWPWRRRWRRMQISCGVGVARWSVWPCKQQCGWLALL